MDEWVDGFIVGWIDGSWVFGRMTIEMENWIDGFVDAFVSRWMRGWMDILWIDGLWVNEEYV